MKTCYGIRLDNTSLAIADLCDYYHKGLMITRINVPKLHRSKGIGTKLLLQILDDADKHGTTLFLEVSASDGLNRDQLMQWYCKHGFKGWLGIFMRQPLSGAISKNEQQANSN